MSGRTQLPRIHRFEPTLLVVVGSVFAFFGERVLLGYATPRLILAILSAACLLSAVGWRSLEVARARPENTKVAQKLLVATLGVLLALALYAPLGLWPDGQGQWPVLLSVGWPIVFVLALAPLLAVEATVWPVARLERYEEERVRRAIERSLSLALLAAVLFAGNYLVKSHDVKADFSVGRIGSPSESTRRLVRDLATDVTVTLFFPRVSDVVDALEPYFEPLERLSPRIKVQHLDQALTSSLAASWQVTDNGFVVLTHGYLVERIRLNSDLRLARVAIRTFDGDFARALIKVSRESTVVYFTAGHGERVAGTPTGPDVRPNLAMIRRALEQNQHEVRELGVGQGLATEVPQDAAVVLIMGPEKAFLDQEVNSLRRYVQRGGRLLLALDPERSELAHRSLAPLLAELGVKVDSAVLANDESFFVINRSVTDHELIYSNIYSSHASITTLTRNPAQLAVIMVRAAAVEATKPPPPDVTVDLPILPLEGTYADLNGNRVQDASDRAPVSGLAAAVVKKLPEPLPEARVWVFGDVDAFTDPFVVHQGNPYLWSDVMSWLRAVEDAVPPAVSEADVRIMHKREEDAVWFYSTTVGAPLLFGLAGFLGLSRRRAR